MKMEFKPYTAPAGGWGSAKALGRSSRGRAIAAQRGRAS